MGSISCGLIDVRPMLGFAKATTAEIVFPKRSKASREFSKLIRSAVIGVPDNGGVYVWGRYIRDGLWQTTYIGKTTHGKVASLRYRISDELREEKIFAWAACDVSQRLMQIYLDVWGDLPAARRHFDRAIRKAPTEVIAWVSCPDYDESTILTCEAMLIKHFSPTANIKRPGTLGSTQLVKPIIDCLNNLLARA